jgi:hypothetical protein
MGPVIEMAVSCAAAPLQLEGTVNGKSAYFRSRHGHWAFHVACIAGRDARSDPHVWTWRQSRGVTSERTARAIIARCVEGWTDWDGQGEG